MCYTRRKIEGGVGALRETDDANFLKPNGQSRNLNIYEIQAQKFVKSIEQNMSDLSALSSEILYW